MQSSFENFGQISLSFETQSLYEQYDIKSIGYNGKSFSIGIKTAATIKSMVDLLKKK